MEAGQAGGVELKPSVGPLERNRLLVLLLLPSTAVGSLSLGGRGWQHRFRLVFPFVTTEVSVCQFARFASYTILTAVAAAAMTAMPCLLSVLCTFLPQLLSWFPEILPQGSPAPFM